MCGIAGFYTAGPLDQSADDELERMLNIIRHRGPDGTGRYLNQARGLAMGHARLSINDLATGDQPLKSPDGRYVLTVNGEFYDFKKHRSIAMAEGMRYRCKSDSEIALTLYEKYGRSFVDHLRGEFAFTLYDAAKDELILVRDRFGIRPLFYRFDGDQFYYGSEIKALLAHSRVPVAFDSKAVLNQMMQTMVPGTTAFQGIEALQPGHMMIVKRRDGRLTADVFKYWDLDFPLERDRRKDDDPAPHIRQIREKLVEAIVFRLEADVPVGCYLSGGIDSCCILGLAAGAMQSPVKAFTISFDDDAYDEAAIAREMAKSMGADHEIINLGADSLYGDNFVQTVWHAERTFYNTLGVAKYLMSRRVHECDYKSVITGEGSDELFGGYPAFKRDMILHGIPHESEDVRRRYERLLDESNRIFRGAILAESERENAAWTGLCGFTPSWIQPWIATLDVARSLLSNDLKEELRDYDPVAAIAEKIDREMVRGRHPLDVAQYTWAKTQLEGQILNWGGDRVDMANSMESRPAFLDHHLADAAVQVPPRYRIFGNIEKWVLREAVRGVLPEVLYKREKFAFMAPPAHTDERKQKAVDLLIREYLNPDSIKSAGLFDASRTEQFLKAYRGDADSVSLTRSDTILNHLLCLQILHRMFIEQPVASLV